jgi:hypothetical protein
VWTNRALGRWGAVASLLVSTGCSSRLSPNPSAGLPDGGDASGLLDANHAAAEGGTDDAQLPVATCEQPITNVPPGPAIANPHTAGRGGCASRTLGQVIQSVYGLDPELADITSLYDPWATTFDGSFIYAFGKDDGGFALAFKRGGGDCPAGCTLNEYWYFQTDESCKIVQVGHLDLTQNSCLPADQKALWGQPPLAPSGYCGVSDAPEDLNGTYDVAACGTQGPCSLDAKGAAIPVMQWLRIVIAQDPQNPSVGTVTFVDPTLPELDGTPIAATFKRRSFSASLSMSNLPADCIEQRTIGFDYDFDNYGQSQLTVNLVQTPNCATAANYCKGYVNAKLGRAVKR